MKRLAARLTSGKEANNELAPIIENIQMDFKSPTHCVSSYVSDKTISTSESDNGAGGASDSGGDATSCSSATPTLLDCPPPPYFADDSIACDITFLVSVPIATYHLMTHEELLAQMRQLHQQKRNIRSVLRTFENDFYKKTGRHVEKEDRCHMSAAYQSYKVSKSQPE